MGRETLSIKQANNIITEINDITKETRNKIEISGNQFLSDISKIWEDQNAVEFSSKFGEAITNIVDNLSTNNNKFCDEVKNIANAYVKAGNMEESVTAIANKLAIQLRTNYVKEYFSESENGDDFGFINPETGPSQVMNSIDGLKKDIVKIISDTVNRIKHINAFGNTEVQLALASSASAMINIVEDEINKTAKSCSKLIEDSARKYSQVGQAAESGADIGGSSSPSSKGGTSGPEDSGETGSSSAEESNKSDFITIDDYPVVKYGPPTPNWQSIDKPISQENIQIPNTPTVKYGPPTP